LEFSWAKKLPKSLEVQIDYATDKSYFMPQYLKSEEIFLMGPGLRNIAFYGSTAGGLKSIKRCYRKVGWCRFVTLLKKNAYF
jgi:hypothetical protein